MRFRPLPLLSLLWLATPATAATVTIGEIDFPLGEAAFPSDSVCVNASGCPGDLVLVDALMQPVPRADALLDHDLSLVVIDMDATNEFRLTFSQPVANLPGDDLYLAQAEFTGDPELEDGIHAMEIRFDGSATWHTVPTDQFRRDVRAGVPIVSMLDPEFKQAGYFLWITTQDLTDFGFDPGESITAFDLRAATAGLDAAAAGNLNLPEPTSSSLLSAGILLLALLVRARRRAV